MPKLPRYILPFTPHPDIRRRPAPFHKTFRRMKHCIDFAMPENTPVLAARDGIVLQCRDSLWANYTDPKYAKRCNFIIILHADGEESHYVHLQHGSACVTVEQCVRAGQMIARSGQTGYATYPHLHFGVYNLRDTNIPVRFRTAT